MTGINYSEKIPNNVDLSGDRTLQRALEQWQPLMMPRLSRPLSGRLSWLKIRGGPWRLWLQRWLGCSRALPILRLRRHGPPPGRPDSLLWSYCLCCRWLGGGVVVVAAVAGAAAA